MVDGDSGRLSSDTTRRSADVRGCAAVDKARAGGPVGAIGDLHPIAGGAGRRDEITGTGRATKRVGGDVAGPGVPQIRITVGAVERRDTHGVSVAVVQGATAVL